VNWKRYKNEFIVVFTLVLMLSGLLYKYQKVSTQTMGTSQIKTTLSELKEVIALQDVWGDKKINKKVDKLKTHISTSKLKWQKKGRKITATFSTLNASELNRVVSKILNLAVEIQTLKIKKVGSSYTMEFKCKW